MGYSRYFERMPPGVSEFIAETCKCGNGQV